MKQVPIDRIRGLPDAFLEYVRNAPLYDSSCSPEARVWFADRDGGLYIKTAPAGTLKTEAEMTAFFHSKHLGPQVLAYQPLSADWMVTRAVPGADCTHRQYLEDPKKLSETTALLLRQLHETDSAGCPVQNRNEAYVSTALRNHAAGIANPEFLGFSSAEEAWSIVQSNQNCLDSQVLLHGDYCLPNILLDNWRFSDLIDVGSGGIGDRHIDLFWGAWTLMFNLKEARWCSRFLDAYGRDAVDTEKLRILAAFEVFG